MNDINQQFLNDENKKLINVALLLIAILSIVFLFSLYISKGVRVEKRGELVKKVDPFVGITLQAKSAIVVDLKNQKVLYELDADTVRPLASLTKIMTAITALDMVPSYSVVTINKEFLKEEGDNGLYKDERWALKDLLDFSLVTSSNDGITAIASAAGAMESGSKNLLLGKQDFIKKMNEKAASMKLATAKFSNVTGLDESTTESGGYASARDTARIFAYALRNKPQIFEATKRAESKVTSLSNITHKAVNTNESVNLLPGLIGSKTGFTDLAGGNLGVIIDPDLGRPIVIVVLDSTTEGRFSDVELLAQKSLEAVALGL